jgi:hypothetical protein
MALAPSLGRQGEDTFRNGPHGLAVEQAVRLAAVEGASDARPGTPTWTPRGRPELMRGRIEGPSSVADFAGHGAGLGRDAATRKDDSTRRRFHLKQTRHFRAI